MNDIFNTIENEFRNQGQLDEIKALLKANHWEESPLPMNNRHQRIAHELYVLNHTPEQVAASEGVSKERIRMLSKEAIAVLSRLAEKEKIQRANEVPEYDYDVREVMIDPTGDIDEIKRLLSCDLAHFPLAVSTRSSNALRAQNICTLNDLVLRPPIELMKFRNMGRGGIHELKVFLDSVGLKWRNYEQRPAIIRSSVWLPGYYPINNFVWPAMVLRVFDKLDIKTMADLMNSTDILIHPDLTAHDRKFIETRLKEWTPKHLLV